MNEVISIPAESDFVFNIVWTGTVFDQLRYFVGSQIAQSGARYRFLANGCSAEQISRMDEFAAHRADRVIEVVETSTTMCKHGHGLDRMLTERDDGGFFCFIDPDILASGPFLTEFAQALTTCAGVTSGRGVWRDDDVLPDGHPGVSGEYFYSPDGYLFGSPHFAMYRRAPLLETRDRWGVGFNSGSPKQLSEDAQALVRDAGQEYWMYDTGKLMNIFLQEDGNTLRHFESEFLMHIGGVSHYLAPTGVSDTAEGTTEPDWKTWSGMETRFGVAEYTAGLLRELIDGRPAPPLPDRLDPAMTDRLSRVRRNLITIMDDHREEFGPDS